MMIGYSFTRRERRRTSLSFDTSHAVYVVGKIDVVEVEGEGRRRETRGGGQQRREERERRQVNLHQPN